MGINVASNFDVSTNLPLDSRSVRADNTARDAIGSGLRFEGLKVYVLSEQKTFVLKGGITNAHWAEDGGSPVPDVSATGQVVTGGDKLVIQPLIANQAIYVEGSSGPVTTHATEPFDLTSNVNHRVNGMLITVVGLHDTNTVTIPVSDTTAGMVPKEVTLKKFQAATFRIVFYSTTYRVVLISTNFLGGGGVTKVATLTSSGTIASDVDYVLADATSGNLALTLPASALYKTLHIVRKDSSANTVTISRAGSDQILTAEGLVNSVTLPYQANNLKIAGVATNLWGPL